MTKSDIITTTKDLIAAPSCYAPLKDKAQAWLDNPDDKVIAKEFITELEGDITSIDSLVSFANSPAATKIFGEEGAKYCDCAACTAGLKILEGKDIILK